MQLLFHAELFCGLGGGRRGIAISMSRQYQERICVFIVLIVVVIVVIIVPLIHFPFHPNQIIPGV